MSGYKSGTRRIISVKAQISCFIILFGLHPLERILKITDNLSKTLQAESLSAAEAQQIAIHILQGVRENYRGFLNS